MGGRGRTAGTVVVSMRPRTHLTRSARQRRQALLKLGIWIFLVVFALSVVGVGFISVSVIH
jgi:hypothetical protein